MRGLIIRVALAISTLAATDLPMATDQPLGLAGARPGVWDVSRSATGAHAERVCLADPTYLAQWEHRGQACTRVMLGEHANAATFEYRCVGGGFGHSEMTLLTPRTLRVEMQGISGGMPFDYVIHARRVGGCRHPLSTGLPSAR